VKLYFLRHGKADWPEWNKPDDERPLTKEGKREMRQIGEFLRELKVSPAVSVSSPLPRALQTAEIAAEALRIDLREDAAVGKGFDATKLRGLIKRDPGGDLMIVGHEPDFSTVIEALTGGRVKLRKGGVARVDVEGERVTSGCLAWLIPPKVARA